MVIQYLQALFSSQDLPQIDAEVKRACWTADQLFQLLTDCRNKSVWLEPREARQAQILGENFLKTYVGLHQKFHGSNFKLFNCRPKLHLMAHMVANFATSPRNPLVDAVWMDENWIGQVLKLARKTHSRRTHVSTLFRYTAGSATSISSRQFFFLYILALAGLQFALKEACQLLANASANSSSSLHDMLHACP